MSLSITIERVRIRDSVMMRTHRASSARKARKTIRVRTKRRLTGNWCIEPTQDMVAQHCFDIEAELEAALLAHF